MQCQHPIQIPNPKYKNQKNVVMMEVPCKRCTSCRVNRSREWALRMTHEARYHDRTMYLTLTYDNEHLGHLDLETGEIIPDLSKRDVQLFLMRLRFQIQKTYHKKIRYYLCGEYGGLNGRPHYHAILFGIGLIPDFYNFFGPKIQHHNPRIQTANFELKKIIKEAWGNGRVDVDERSVGGNACAYVAKYIQKFDTRTLPEHWQPEFALFSKGLGKKWVLAHKNIIREQIVDKGIINCGGKKVPAPQYYFEKVFTREELKEIKEKNTPEYLKILQAHAEKGSGLPSVIASAEREKRMAKMSSDMRLARMKWFHQAYQKRKKI